MGTIAEAQETWPRYFVDDVIPTGRNILAKEVLRQDMQTSYNDQLTVKQSDRKLLAGRVQKLKQILAVCIHFQVLRAFVHLQLDLVKP